jgi:hypothetical protein
MKPAAELTGPLNVVFAIFKNLRVIAHPCIVSITSARSVDTSKKFLDVFEYYSVLNKKQQKREPKLPFSFSTLSAW